MHAIANIKKLCEFHILGDYSLEIIDIYQQPSFAEDQQIIAAPTLIKVSPLPLRRLIGDLSDTPKVLRSLDISSEK